MPGPQLDVVLPVYNEAASIAPTVEEIFECTRAHFDVRVIACEDGSDDGTQDELARLARRLPVSVLSRAERRGYAAAVIDGLRATESEWVLVMDADGQCDPADILRLWAARDEANVVIGCRRPRRDALGRRVASRAFGLLYRALFSVPVADPSCPFVLMRRESVLPLLAWVGGMPFGLWWELVATAHCSGLKIADVPIHHRRRRQGRTRAFPLRSLPGAALTQLAGLGRLWRATRALQSAQGGKRPPAP